MMPRVPEANVGEPDATGNPSEAGLGASRARVRVDDDLDGKEGGVVMWVWEPIDTGVSNASGDLAKLFKNEEVAQPAQLAVGAPTADATVLAREVIQNSWDAARELQRTETAAGREPPEFEIRFKFHSLTGDRKRSLVENLGLEELASRAEQNDRHELGLAEDDCLPHLADPDHPLRVLEIVESATTGMGGSWDNGRSKLYLALVSVGFTVKDEGAGGSYGYGKSGLIRGSRVRTILAYTRFREEPSEPGVTARALGMTYWGGHDHGDRRYTGFARAGDLGDDGRVRPCANDAAHQWVQRLGLSPRRAENVEDLGTTFLVVDPTILPEDLCVAIERNWWPALVEGHFHVEVEAEDGTVLTPRPKRDETLRSFIRAYELATVPQDNSKPEERRITFNAMALSDSRVAVGSLGLLADARGWSWPPPQPESDDGPIEHRSLVALIRGPRMVVEYHDFGSTAPYVRGAFVAHPDVDDLLRQTEPKAHDAWQVHSHGDAISPDATEVAKSIHARIRRYVRDFRNSLRPPTPDRREIRLPVFDDLFRNLMKPPGNRPDAPTPVPRDLAIRIRDQDLEAAGPNAIRFTTTVEFALSDHAEVDEAEVELEVKFVFVEDERLGSTPAGGSLAAPSGWTVDPERPWLVRGRLGHDPVRLRLQTDPYDAGWTGRLIARGALVAPSTVGSGEEAQ